MAAALVIVAMLVLAVIGPIVWGSQATAINVPAALKGPSGQHLFGTDQIGRDIFARTMAATRLSLELAVLSTLIAVGIGIPIGITQAVLGPRLRRLVAAVISAAVAFPGLLLALFVNTIIGIGATGAVLGIGIAMIPGFARLAQTLSASIAGLDYVAAARILGLSRIRILFFHVLPNIAEPLTLTGTMSVGWSLLGISALSFLGLGVRPPSYDWGSLLGSGLQYVYENPLASLGPGALIVLAGLAFNLAGETLARVQGGPSVAGRPWSGAGAIAAAASALVTGPPVAGAGAGGGLGSEPGAGPVAGLDAGPVAGLDAGPDARPDAGTGGEPDPDLVLEVSDLSVRFPGAGGPVTPVRGLSFTIRAAERIGIVGESGSGKSMTVLALAQLLPYPGRTTWKALRYLGRDLRSVPAPELRHLLGTSMALVFQDPASSLNPALRVGRQLAEVVQVHAGLGRREAMALAVTRLRDVQIARPELRAQQYPHEFSGGMRQRAMIATGLMGRPRLIIADEPTTALDVTVQRQILLLLRQVNQDSGAAVVMISHDVSVVTMLCQRVLVMYAGRIVEDISTERLLAGPAHPYTRALLASVPDMSTDRDRPLVTIAGRPPALDALPPGCAFAPRCPLADERCRASDPALETLAGDHRVACWHPQPAAGPGA
jgi:oligopeptide/dipeptide ABC transporter ATP-binding protein